MRKGILLICLLFGVWAVNAQTVSITFQVDMSVQIAKGAFNPAQHQVSARGDFNGWGETAMTDDNSDSVYTVTVPGIAQNSTVAYKYFHSGGGGTWEDGDNKQVAVGTTDTTLTVAFFNGEAMPSGAAANVTFEVDMRLPAKQDATFPTRKVFVAGNFTDWGTGAIEMADADNDTVYSVTTPINSGQLLQYKFIHSATDAASGSWEDGDNRTYWVVDGDQTVHRFFNDVDPNVTLADGNIFFQVDMTVFDEIGIYDAVQDSVRLYAGFNGWNDGGDPTKWRMTQDVVNPLLWSISVPFEQSVVNGEHNYKFFIKMGDTTKAALWTDGWERPVSQGGGNRDIMFSGQPDQVAADAYFDDVPPDWVIPAGTSLDVTFRVDMKPAMAPAVGFTPATDKLYWLAEIPSFVYTQGWADSDTMRVLELTDTDADSIYEGTLSVQAPTFNVFEYRYAFARNGEWTQESAGFGDFAYRVRFVGQSAARTFPINPWTMPMDTWSDSDVKSDQDTDPYTAYTLTGVETEGAVPSSYFLHQNYPNPFNPSTVIKFNLSTKEQVALKVYNLLGQQVATLVNEELVPGSYKVTFDAKGLASGMYVYRLTAGSFVQTRRMLLLK